MYFIHISYYNSSYYSCCDNMTKLESYEGYSESISCPYESQYQNNLKYMCRGNQRSTCRRQALITSHMKNKYRIHEDKTARIFTTTISDLHSEDAGQYWCGVTRTGKDIYTEVNVMTANTGVKIGLLKTSFTTAYLHFWWLQCRHSLFQPCRANRC
uniref:Immunoglobulin V-set domain-containing protein n=1 Tax=Maylandia zebra TaxID=106582 RepID=A0A3P9BFQ4_9CICH